MHKGECTRIFLLMRGPRFICIGGKLAVRFRCVRYNLFSQSPESSSRPPEQPIEAENPERPDIAGPVRSGPDPHITWSGLNARDRSVDKDDRQHRKTKPWPVDRRKKPCAGCIRWSWRNRAREFTPTFATYDLSNFERRTLPGPVLATVR